MLWGHVIRLSQCFLYLKSNCMHKKVLYTTLFKLIINASVSRGTKKNKLETVSECKVQYSQIPMRRHELRIGFTYLTIFQLKLPADKILKFQNVSLIMSLNCQQFSLKMRQNGRSSEKSSVQFCWANQWWVRWWLRGLRQSREQAMKANSLQMAVLVFFAHSLSHRDLDQRTNRTWW